MNPVTLLQKAIQFDTTDGKERPLAEYLVSVLRDNNVQAELCPVGDTANLVARIPGKVPGNALLFSGHLDTVPSGENWSYPPFSGIIEGERIYGLGASDMKGGLCAMVKAFIELSRQGFRPQHDLLLLGTAGEEFGFEGATHFAKTGGMDNVGAVIIGEPTDGKISCAYKGCYTLDITTHGATAHSSRPQLGTNAIDLMTRFLTAFYEWREEWGKKIHPALGSPSASVNWISGGTVANVVPDICRVLIDLRLLSGETEESLLGAVQGTVDKIIPGRATVQGKYFLPSLETPADHPLIRAAQEVLLDIGRMELGPIGFHGVTDYSIFARSKNVPFIIWGPGSIDVAHRANEYVVVKDYLGAIEFYIKMAKSMPRYQTISNNTP